MRARRRFKLSANLTACVFFCAFFGNLWAEPQRHGSASLFVRDFNWREYGPTGTQLLEEEGLLFGGALRGEQYTDWRGLRYGLTSYIGDVDYSGSVQSGTEASTDTSYAGGSLWADLMPIHAFDDGSSIRAYLGLGMDLWHRSINDGTTPSGAPAYGYTETWVVLQPRAGVGASLALGRGKAIFADALVRLPGVAWNMVDLNRFGVGDVTVNPKPETSMLLEGGFSWQRLTVAASYETLRYGESERETAALIFQPDSEADLLTFSIGLCGRF